MGSLDLTHLLFNMLALFSFGRNVEYYFSKFYGSNGTLYFTLLYFGAILAASIPSYFKHQDNYGYTSLGASGGTSAIMFASLIFDPWSTILIYFIPVPAILGGIGYLAYSSWASKNSNDNIAHDAHFYGAVFGFLFPILVKPELLNFFISKLMSRF